MKFNELAKPAVPVAYGHLILDVAAERGVPRAQMLAGMGLPAAVLETADARLSLLQAGQLLYRALKLSGDPALGYEIGLRSNLSSHGFIGFGVMSSTSLRQAIEFGAKFLKLRLPNLSLQLLVDGEQAALAVAETTPLGEVRQVMFDLFLVGLWRMAPMLMPGRDAAASVELWFDYPEPAYCAAYRTRLPRLRFSMGTNQLRFPAVLLDRPLGSGNLVSARLVVEQCERELSLLGYTQDLPGRVRAALVMGRSGYPDQAAVARSVHVSVRTLKRRLQQEGLRFQDMLDQARRRDAIRLLQDPSLNLAEVGQRLGYADPASFTRAFRKWTQLAPSVFRAQLQDRATPAASG